MGFFDVFKKSKKQVIKENQSIGKAGEDRIKTQYEMSGYKVTRTGRGHDYKAEKKDWITGKKHTKYLEVKTTQNGNPRLSKLQKKKKRQFGNRYVVEKVERTPLGLSSGSIFGSGSSSKKRKTKKSSSYDSIFGTGSPSKKLKSKKSSKYDALIGSSKSLGSKKGKSYRL